MGALQQYLDLYNEHKDLLNSKGNGLVNSFRDKAYEILRDKGLPAKGSENYETTDLDNLLAPDFGLNLSRIEIDTNPKASFHCGVPSLSTMPVFIINDLLWPCYEGEKKEEDIWTGSLKNFYLRFPDVAKKYYGTIADINNPIVALNSLFCQDGFVIWVKEGSKIKNPLQIVNIFHNGMPLMGIRRLLVIVEDNADVKLVSCDHTQISGINFASLQTIEVFVGKGASLDFYELEESSEKTSRLSTLFLHQKESSHVEIESITLYNGFTRNEYYAKFLGKDSSLKLFGLGIEDKQRQLDIYSKIEHDSENCHTDELFKYVVEDEATGYFAGLIKVDEGAVKTEAYQNNRNIVGSEKARMFSKPQLEIYADDVKCSHGCATGQLDEMQVFYMQTRGIPEKEAKFLLKQAFMTDVIEGVKLPLLKERLKILVERRFSGEQLNCAACAQECNTVS